MDPEQMIQSARRQANTGGNPTQEDLNRSVSTAYYALFHTLANSCADLLVGSTDADRASDEWAQAYRALDHGQARRQCSRGEVSRYSLDMQRFAETFCEFQEDRHNADYSPRADFDQAQVESIIDRAASAIAGFTAAPEDERRRFVVYLALRYRRT